LPYELYVTGGINADKKTFDIKLTTANEVFGKRSAGCPFTVYATSLALNRNYTVAAGDKLADSWSLDDFRNGQYHLAVHGPNGFFREFKGGAKDPSMHVDLYYDRLSRRKLSGNVTLTIESKGPSALQLLVKDNSYGAREKKISVNSSSSANLMLDLSKSSGWYDFTVTVAGHKGFSQRFAGHVETGSVSITDPLMGRVV
jgi:phospholipase C